MTALAQSWFKDIIVVWPEDIKSQLEKYLVDNKLFDTPYDGEKRVQIRAAVSKILGKPVTQFKSILKEYGFDEIDCSKNKESSTYGMKKIVRL